MLSFSVDAKPSLIEIGHDSVCTFIVRNRGVLISKLPKCPQDFMNLPLRRLQDRAMKEVPETLSEDDLAQEREFLS